MIGLAAVFPNPAAFRNRRGLPLATRVALPAAALLLQTTIPTLWSPVALLNLPLLAALHVMIESNSVVAAMFTGMLVGWAQDGLTHGPLGLFGLVYTALGYVSVLANQLLRLNLIAVLAAFVGSAYLVHEVLLFMIRKYLMDQAVASEPLFWVALSILHAGLALAIYPFLPKQAAYDPD